MNDCVNDELTHVDLDYTLSTINMTTIMMQLNTIIPAG